jgi:molybdenum cofactor cytidylyltransferase
MEDPSEPDHLILERRTVAVLLAAGASERLGGEPKALLPVGPETAIRRMARIATEAGLARVVTVVGAHRTPIEEELAGSGSIVVFNEDWAAGRTGSVQAGLLEAGPADQVLLWPVDHPFVRAGTVAGLVGAAPSDALAVWLVPTYRGAGGHPVVLRPPVFARVLELPASAPLRALLPVLGPQVLRIPVDDPGVTAKVDTPESYRTHEAAWRDRGGDGDGP